MKRGLTLFLKAVVSLIGIASLAICVFLLPEMVNRNAVQDPEIAYLRYPFLIYAYITAIPFFSAIYQALKLLSDIEESSVFSEMSLNSLRYIKYCAITTSGLIVAGTLFVIIFIEGDRAGVIALGIYTTFASIVAASLAAVLQKLLRNALDIKLENELTV